MPSVVSSSCIPRYPPDRVAPRVYLGHELGGGHALMGPTGRARQHVHVAEGRPRLDGRLECAEGGAAVVNVQLDRVMTLPAASLVLGFRTAAKEASGARDSAEMTPGDRLVG
jgi:hypothetical protein